MSVSASDSIYDYILKKLETVDTKNLEVEIRINNINAHDFNKLYGYFYAVFSKTKAQYSVTYSKPLSTVNLETIRKEVSIDKEGISSSYIIKNKNNKVFGHYTVSFATEVKTTEEKYEETLGTILVRKRERYPFQFSKKFQNNTIRLFRVDLTKVTTSGTTNENSKYECEIEFSETFLKNWKKLKNIFDNLMTRIEWLYEEPFDYVKHGSMSPVNHSVISKPINLKKEHLKSLFAYAITNKLDGQRKQIYFAENGIFMNDSTGYIKYDDINCKELRNTILDAEFYDDALYIFDEVRTDNKNFKERYENMKKAQKILKEKSEKKYIVKNFVFCSIDTSISSSIKKILEDSKKYRNDGLIFVPINEKYSNWNTYKWKPPEELTIDFMLVRHTTNVA